MVGLKNNERESGKNLGDQKIKLKNNNKAKIITITNNLFDSLKGIFQKDVVDQHIKRLVTIVSAKYIVSFASNKVQKLILNELLKQIDINFPAKIK